MLLKRDNNKTKLNKRKHGIAFNKAQTVFTSSLSLLKTRPGGLLLFILIMAISPDSQAMQFIAPTYTVSNGLTTNLVKSACRDSAGFIWLATDEGLVQFDGKTFYNHAGRLPTPYIKDLYLTRDSRLIVVHDQGIHRVQAWRDSIVFSKLLPGGGSTDSTLFYPKTFYEDHSGAWWISEPDAVVRYRNGHLKRYYFAEKYRTNSYVRSFYVVEDDNDRIYAIAERGHVFFYQAEADSFVELAIPPPAAPFLIDAVVMQPHGKLWAGSNVGLYELTFNTILENLTWRLAVNLPNISALVQDPAGRLYLGTWGNGVHVFDPRLSPELIQPETQNSPRVVNNLRLTPDGVLLVSSDEGFTFFKTAFFKQLSLPSSNFYIHTVAVDSAGIIYTSEGDHIYRIEKNGVTETINKIYTKPGSLILSLLVVDDDLWIGYRDGFVERLRHGTTRRIDLPDLGNRVINDMALDHLGNLWVCQDGLTGVYKIGPDWRVSHYGLDQGLPTHVICLTNRADDFYAGSSGKNSHLYRYNRQTDRFENLTVNTPWPTPQEPVIDDMAFDAAGRLWLGTNQGLWLYDQGRISQPDGLDDLARLPIKAIAVDSLNQVWSGTNRGLFRYAGQTVTAFGMNDGLSSTTMSYRALCLDRRQRLWVGTASGLSVWQADVGQRNQTPSPQLIKLLVNGRPVYTLTDSTVFADQSYFEMTFATLCYPAEHIQYQTRRNDLQKEWEPPDLENQRIIPRLRYGHYQFEIRARQSGYDWSPPTVLKFNVAPPWYLSRPAYFGCAALLLAFIAAGRQFWQTLRLKRAAELETARLARVTASLGELVVIIDLDGKINFVNAALLDRYGDQRRQIIGQPFARLFSAEMSAVIEAGRASAIASGRWRDDVIGQTSVDETFWLSITLTPLLHENKHAGLVAVLRDISERKESEKALIIARLAAEQAARAKADFLATMSHEIRTPMNGVIGMTELLLQTPLNEEQRDFVGTIRVSGESLLNIINDILDFSKIEAGKMELEHRPVSVNGLLEDVYRLAGPRSQAKGLELTYDVNPDVPAVIMGDVMRLRQVLGNLMSNAIKFTENGEISTSVEKIGEENGLILKFSIRDTGIGIPAEKVDKLFNAFSQVDSSTTRKYGGTGLGLAICRKLVELMNGRIWIESEPGQGSTFSFTIASAISNEPAEVDPIVSILAGKHALILGGGPAYQKMLSSHMNCWQMRPCAITTTAEIERLIANKFYADVILLDSAFANAPLEKLSGLLYEKRPDQATILCRAVDFKPDSAAPDSVAAILNRPILQSQLLSALGRVFAVQSKPVTPPAVVTPADATSPPAAETRRILLAEDVEANIKIMRLILQKMDFSVDIARNGREAIEKLTQQTYDLIFMDVQMPEMDGLEAAWHIVHKMALNPRPPIIAMTANAMQGDRERCLEAGMDDYITKPVQIQQIKEMIEKWGRSDQQLSETASN